MKHKTVTNQTKQFGYCYDLHKLDLIDVASKDVTVECLDVDGMVSITISGAVFLKFDCRSLESVEVLLVRDSKRNIYLIDVYICICY